MVNAADMLMWIDFGLNKTALNAIQSTKYHIYSKARGSVVISIMSTGGRYERTFLAPVSVVRNTQLINPKVPCPAIYEIER